MMELDSLKQFLVVARLEHLSRAADELHVAQPSLSRTIARLKGELGVPLSDRGGPGLPLKPRSWRTTGPSAGTSRPPRSKSPPDAK
jgi:DNA-binding transcriptional LysR family regulator